MSQNIYDDERFFRSYRELPRSRHGLSAAPEWPSLRAMLPDLHGARVLDLGCGFGAFARWAVSQGAAQVIGIDLSENMLAHARELTGDGSIDYRRGDLSALELPERGFDLVYSALAFHYVEDFPALCREIRTRLVDGGRLVASVEHPLFTAPSDPAWREGANARPVWPVDRYLDEGKRVTDWLAPGVVKYHRTLHSYVNTLLENGFDLLRLLEWGPDPEQVAEHPEWSRERERPMFLLLAAERAPAA